MDEKGIQLGGGQKDGKKSYYFKRLRKQCYKLRSDNLELVTVIECVSVGGHKAPTSFILKDGPAPDIQGVDNVGRYVIIMTIISIITSTYKYLNLECQCQVLWVWMDRPWTSSPVGLKSIYPLCSVQSCWHNQANHLDYWWSWFPWTPGYQTCSIWKPRGYYSHCFCISV